MASNITIARLNTLVTANAVQFTKELDKAAAVAKSRGAGINKALSSVGNIAGALGVGLSVGAVVSFGKSVIDLGGRITDLASVADLKGRSLQTISVLAGDAGVSMEEVAKASEKMRSKIQDAKSNGADPLNKSLEKLGLSAAGLSALTTDEKWQAIADKLSHAKDQQEAMNIASDIFGEKIGPKLRAAFEGISSGIDNASASMSSLIIPDATLRRLDDAGDRLERLGKFGMAFGAGLLDSQTSFGDLNDALRDQFDLLDSVEGALGRVYDAWWKLQDFKPAPGTRGGGLPKIDPRVPGIENTEPGGFQLPRGKFTMDNREQVLIQQKMRDAEEQASMADFRKWSDEQFSGKGDGMINDLIREKAKNSEIGSLLDLFFDDVDKKQAEMAKKAAERRDLQDKANKNAQENELFTRNNAFAPNTPTDAYSRIGLMTGTGGENEQKRQTNLLKEMNSSLQRIAASSGRTSAAYAN